MPRPPTGIDGRGAPGAPAEKEINLATTLEGPQTIEALLEETRRFPPPESFRARALVHDPAVYESAQRDPEAFWGGQARELLDWYQPFGRVLDWDPPHAQWFLGGTLNAAYNCVDRHIATWRRSKAAIVFEGEPGDERVLTYQDLYREVNRAAIALRYLGVGKGDRVAIYLPMVPELAIAMLACARLGAPHTVVFGGFSSEALRDRINDCGAKLLITADGGWRRGNVVPLKLNADRAVAGAPTIEHVVVVRRIGEREPVVMRDGLDLWWDELLDEAERATGEKIVPPEPVDSEHPLFILYTSGTTGKPKGVLHTTAGYLVGTSLTHKWIFDLKEDDVYWCTADVGWVTGHSYIVYGPLCNGATTVMYEGAPDYPDKDRFWAIVEKHRATILYTAPTAIRAFMRWGDEYPQRHDMSSLRLLGTVGEPINPEAWMWYRQVIGGDRCPIVDTWWQTETGMIMISPLPGVTTTKPGSATFAFPGVGIDVVDENGSSVKTGGGFLVLTHPWPAMLRTLWGDDARYVETYWRRFPGKYYTGDGCKRDEDGYLWLLGRVDDVLNVAGHRLSTMEIESALVSHPAVAEAAVIGVTDELTGQAVAAFATLRSGIQPTEQLRRELREHVGIKIGPIARPRQVFFTGELPKTRSGKIMRRLLRDIAEGRVLGDTTTLLDAAVLGPIQKEYEKTEV